MNAKLYILAILSIIILALYMTAYAPAPETGSSSYQTLGGDCSADRATGDLYVHSHNPYANQPDPYCLIDQGTTDNLPGDVDKDRGSDHSYVPTDKQADHPDSSTSQNGKRPRKQREDKPNTPVEPSINTPGSDGSNPPAGGQIDQPGGGGTGPQINPSPDDPDKDNPGPKDDKPSKPQDKGGSKPKDDGKHAPKVDQKPKDPDTSSDDKQCQKAGRDNTNSQGNHNCSKDNPDTNSGQQRTTDHGPSGQSQGNGHDKEKGKKDH